MAKDELTTLELNEFLAEMASVIKARLDKQEAILAGLDGRIKNLEEKNNGSITDIKRKIASLEENIRKSRLSRDILKGLEI